MATGRTVKDVSPHEFVKAYAAHLKRSGKPYMSLVSERNYVNEEKQDGLTWMVKSGGDVDGDGLEIPNTCTKECPGCVSRGRSLRRSSQNQEKEIVRNLRESGLSYREVLKGEKAEDTTRWGNNPDIIPGMFYAFILQDAMRFELCSGEVTGRLVEVIEDCRWAELEVWLDINRDVLLQHLEANAPTPGIESSPFVPQGEPPRRR